MDTETPQAAEQEGNLTCRVWSPAGLGSQVAAFAPVVELRGMPTRRSARYLRGDARRGVMETAEWTRWEWKIGTGRGCDRHDQLLLNIGSQLAPRVVALPWRVGRQGHRFGPTDPLRRPLRDADALRQRLEGLGYDFWEPGRLLTAGVPGDWLVDWGWSGAVVGSAVCKSLARIIGTLLSDQRLQQCCESLGVTTPELGACIGEEQPAGPRLLPAGDRFVSVLWRTLLGEPAPDEVDLTVVERIEKLLAE